MEARRHLERHYNALLGAEMAESNSSSQERDGKWIKI